MAQPEPIKERIQYALKAFSPYLVRQTLIRKDSRSVKEIFVDFLKQTSSDFCEELRLLGRKEGLEIPEFVYYHLVGDQRDKYGSVFAPESSAYKSVEEREEAVRANELEKLLQNSEVLNEYREGLEPFLKDEDAHKRFAAKVGRLIYDTLSDEEKANLSVTSITQHILNMGYLRFQRSNHRRAAGFLKRYLPIFKDEHEVIDSLLRNYVDEQLSVTPIAETDKRIDELKEEVEEIYGGLK